MTKNKIILKTHGLRNHFESGLVILPERFYVKVDIESYGDFTVEFFNDNDEQLFCITSSVRGEIKGDPIQKTVEDTEIMMAKKIVDMLAEHLLNGTEPAFDTETALVTWEKLASHAFHGCEVEWQHKDIAKFNSCEIL